MVSIVVCGDVVAAPATASADIGRAKFVKRADDICQPQRNHNRKAAKLEQRAERPVRNFDFRYCKPL